MLLLRPNWTRVVLSTQKGVLSTIKGRIRSDMGQQGRACLVEIHPPEKPQFPSLLFGWCMKMSKTKKKAAPIRFVSHVEECHFLFVEAR